MKTLLCGIAVLPFMAATVLAQPAPELGGAPSLSVLSEAQMDGVTAGWSFREIDVSNSSRTALLVYQTGTDPTDDTIVLGPGNNISCGSCYLLINSRAVSIGSEILGGLSPAAG